MGRLPVEKLSHIKQLLQSWRRKGCSKHELLSLSGNWQHASSVVKTDRTFLRCVIDLSKHHLNGHLILNTEFCADLQC